MKRINLFLSIAAVIAALSACSKHENAAPNKNASESSAATQPISTQPAGPIEMKLKWQPGKQYQQEMQMSQSGHMQMPGSGKAVDQQINLVQNYNISVFRTLTNGEMELALTFTDQKVKSTMGSQTMVDFDSSRPTNQDGAYPAAVLVRKMFGVPLKFVVDANGKLVRIENLDAFVSQVAGADPQAVSAVKGMMSEESVKQMVTRGQESLPSKPVKVGDTWPVEMEMSPNAMATLKINMNYTFKGWQEHEGHHCALLEFTGVVTSQPVTNKDFNMTIENGKNAGNVWFDTALNMVIATESRQDMTMKMTLQGRNASSQMETLLTNRLVNVIDLPK